MFDLVGALALSVLYVSCVLLLVAFAPWSLRAKTYVGLGLLLWGALVVAVAAGHGFERGPRPGVPNVAFGVLPPLALLAVVWAFSPSVRLALARIPTWLLVALNSGRILGLFFILLMAQGRLAAPFAPIAGYGDVGVGLLAIPLAISAFRQGRGGAVITVWNVLGALDLFTAVGLGVASAPDATFQIFTTPPGSAAMGTLPWVLIPIALVPFYLMTHLVIASQSWLGEERISRRLNAGRLTEEYSPS